MNFNIQTRPRRMLDREVREPTVLAFALAMTVLVTMASLCAVCILFLPVTGYVWWAFTAIALVMAWLVLTLLRKRSAEVGASTGRTRAFGRILGVARIGFIILLAGWLGLILWLAFEPGGPEPAAKQDPAFVRVITWNIHCGQTGGFPWQEFDWPARKVALEAALDQAQPDILCVQEATPEQIAFLEEKLPGHHRVGCGRDDCKSKGEHCAICFRRQRFEELAGSTFWIEEPIDQPPRSGSVFDIKRICTWVRLRDRNSGHTFRVYNTHLYLTESPNLGAARIILEHIAQGDPADAVVLTADFNAAPSAPSRQLFTTAQTGLTDSAIQAGKPLGVPTFHLYGIGVSCLDGILVDARWRVQNHLILDMKPHNTFPSDHFAILADLALVK